MKLFSIDGVRLSFTDDALDAIAALATERKTGARGLRSIIEGFMTKIMYDIPSRDDVAEVIIHRNCVESGALPELVIRTEQLSSGDDTQLLDNPS
mgnify:CR=1 FL=1